MNLYEYQAKKIFKKYNLPILNGVICSTVDTIKKSIQKVKGPWVGKCQIQSGGRGKAGGVKILTSEQEVKSFITYWLGKKLITYQTDDTGEIVHKILLEPCVNIVNELYLSMIIDRSVSQIVCLASCKGGINIEKNTQKIPNSTHKVFVDPLMGPQIYQGRKLGFDLGLQCNQITEFIKIFMNLGNMFLSHDLMFVEINPLIITDNDHLLCLDAKIRIDRNALFRQEKISLIKNILHENQKKTFNNHNIKLKLNYIPMNGNIGCIVNGAGLAMATMDLLSLYGGKAANFLDIGGDITNESVIEAIKIIIENNKAKIIFINIFGGIVCCNLIAEGIIQALSILNVTIPIVVRLEGNNAQIGNKKLLDSEYNIIASSSFFDAIQKTILIVNRSNNVNFNQ